MKDPHVLGGTPVFRATRVPMQALVDYLEGGETPGLKPFSSRRLFQRALKARVAKTRAKATFRRSARFGGP
jgi:hypothetical protein